MTRRYLITHSEDGIFLGEALGLNFFSKLDPVGQDAACTFPDISEAVELLKGWRDFDGNPIRLEAYTFVPVQPSLPNYFASILDCVAAGLDKWDPND